MDNLELLNQTIEYAKRGRSENLDFKGELTEAYEFLKKMLGIRTDSPEDAIINQRINHSLKVARLLAKWRLNLHVIKAGLLHILTFEPGGNKIDSKAMDRIKKHIDAPTSDILRKYTKLKKLLQDIESQISKGNLIQDRFPANRSPYAFYIIVAHRIEELLREEDHPSGEIRSLAHITEFYLIPELKDQGAFYLVDLLEETCFKITNRPLYNKIYEDVEELQNINLHYYQSFRKEMSELFNPKNADLPSSLKKYRKYIRGFYSTKRSFNSLQRYLITTEYLDNPRKIIENNGIALYVMNLIVRDPAKDEKDTSENVLAKPESIFLQFYQEMQSCNYRHPQFTIHHFSKNYDYVNTSFLISDEADNFYFLTVRTESEHRRYRYGKALDPDQHDLNEMEDKTKIKVRKMDGTIQYIEKGASVLDFAFAIHNEMGLNFNHAKVGGVRREAYYILKNEDQVEIIQNKPGQTIDPDLSWMKYVRTSQAKNELYRYFRSHYRPDDISIHVMRKDGKTEEIEAGATLLDYAFKIHKEKALRYFAGFIDQVSCSMGQELQSGEMVEVILADSPKAELEWFQYVNTTYAKEVLVSYFHEKTGL